MLNDMKSIANFMSSLRAAYKDAGKSFPTFNALCNKVEFYSQFDLSTERLVQFILPKKFSSIEKQSAADRFVQELSEAGTNLEKFDQAYERLQIDSFRGLITGSELKKILKGYVGSSAMNNKADGLDRIKNRFSDRVMA